LHFGSENWVAAFKLKILNNAELRLKRVGFRAWRSPIAARDNPLNNTDESLELGLPSSYIRTILRFQYTKGSTGGVIDVMRA